MTEPRRRRGSGEASRERILDAASEIAGELGFAGTSISLVSERSGLPASSIYWHFKDKDELVAAAIDRSFNRWIKSVERPIEVPFGADSDELFHIMLRRSGGALSEFPDFLRLGLMLVLERRPQELTARKKFVGVRRTVSEQIATMCRTFFPNLDDASVHSIVVLALALSDGLFIAQEVDGVSMTETFDLMATALQGAAARLSPT